MLEIWRVKFRVSPDEYVFVHAVPVQAGNPPTFQPAFCGRTMPETMQQEPEAFDLFINKELANCPACLANAHKVMAERMNPPAKATA